MPAEIVRMIQKLHRWTSHSFVIANLSIPLGTLWSISSSVIRFLYLIQHPERVC